MPLARKLRKKKLHFARLSLIIMITSFNRIWHLHELVFMKGGSPAECGSLFSVIYSMTHLLTHTDQCRRRKWNCLKKQAMKKSNRNSSYFILSSWASSLKGFWNSTLVPMLQGNLLAQDHSVRIFFFSSLQRYIVKVSYYLRYNGFKNVFGFYFYSFTVTFERYSVCYIRFSFRYSVFYFALPSLYPCLLILFQFALRPFTKNAKRR